MASLSTVYGLSLVAGTIAAFIAAYGGNKLHTITQEPAPEPETETGTVVEPAPEPETVAEPETNSEPAPEPETATEPSTAVAPSIANEDTVSDMAGGGFGRPSWTPLNKQATPTLNSLVSTIEPLPSTTSGIQEELNKVTRELEDTSYSIYEIEGSLKSKSNDFEKIRSSYQSAVITKRVSSIEVARLTKDLEPKKDNEPKTGGKPNEFIETLRRALGDDFNRKAGESESDYSGRIINLVEKSTNGSLRKYKPNEDDLETASSKKKWFERMRSSGSGSAPAETIEQKIKKLTDAETKVFQAENTILEKKEDYENLLKEITDLRTKLTDLKIKRNSAETRRVALIGALTIRNKIPTDVTAQFVPASAAEVQEILIRYNKQLAEIQTAERNLKLYFIANFQSSEDRNKLQGLTLGSAGITTEQTRFLTDSQALSSKKKELEKIKLELAGASKVTISELNILLNTLRQNGIAGADEALGNSTFQTVFNTYKKISEAPNANVIIINLEEYWRTFGTKSDYLIGYNGQTVSRAFLYTSELYKRQTALGNVEVSEALKKFTEDNTRIAYNAYANLMKTQETIRKNIEANTPFINTDAAVDALLEGKTIAWNKLVKGTKAGLNYFKVADEKKIESLIKNFKERILDKFISVKIKTSAFGSTEFKLNAKDVEEIFIEIFNKLKSLGDTTENYPIARSYATQLMSLLQSDDPAYQSLKEYIDLTFKGGADSDDGSSEPTDLSKLKTKLEDTQGERKYMLDTKNSVNSLITNNINTLEKLNNESIDLDEELSDEIEKQSQNPEVILSYRATTLIPARLTQLLYEYRIIKTQFISALNSIRNDKNAAQIDEYTNTINESYIELESLTKAVTDLKKQRSQAEFRKFKEKVKERAKNSADFIGKTLVSLGKFFSDPVSRNTNILWYNLFGPSEPPPPPPADVPPPDDPPTGPVPGAGGSHHTRKHSVRSKPNLSRTQRT